MNHETPTPAAHDRYLGLSFSGGGYRAACFSLGTLALLQDLGLSERAVVLSGVSGGSIAVGAYLCAKAGAEAEIDQGGLRRQDWFYRQFFRPFLQFLSKEKMAGSFVNLSWLLQPRKLIKAAADADDRLFQKSLGEPATIGSERIKSLLNHQELSPDFAFFNAADISSLNLFRFGIQKHHGQQVKTKDTAVCVSDQNDTDVILGRWILSCQPQTNLISSLHQFSQKIRIADCVASSHAFPFGLEPMVFPHDFFPSSDPVGPQAVKAFSGSEICGGQKAVALLDGGLYDNLGLASVEDIRTFLLRKSSLLQQSTVIQNNDSGPREAGAEHPPRSAFVVIATDVDNIQPSASFFEAIKAPGSAIESSTVLTEESMIRSLQQLVIKLITVILVVPALPLAIWTKVRGMVWLKTEVPTLLKILGFTDAFVLNKSAKEVKTFRLILSFRRLLLGRAADDNRDQLMNSVQTNLQQLRLSQLTPMVSGYLKRTRSLTYGYLQTNYEQERKQSISQVPHLVRNMIFELAQGADADPDYAARLITLPIQPFGDQNNQEEGAYRESSAMRKLRHAHLAADLILAMDSEANSPVSFLRTIWRKGQVNPPHDPYHGDEDLMTLLDRLQLPDVARLWKELWNRLLVTDGDEDSQPPDAVDCRIDSEIMHLLRDVHQRLQHALHDGAPNVSQVLENCRTTPEPVATINSWIPLICEMATNLPTTLWVKGYSHYIPNHVVQGQVINIGMWFNGPPEVQKIPGPLRDQPILTLAGQDPVCSSAAITTLAGYVTTAFNLLEYYYVFLENSLSLVLGLCRTLTEEQLFTGEDAACKQQVLDLPFAVRQAAARQIQAHWSLIQASTSQEPGSPLATYDPQLLANLRSLENPEGRLELLRPWLFSRGPFPEAWWNDLR